MKHVMIWLIRLYRKYISPLKPPCCRFTPTCSQYAIEAFEKRGFFVGFILATWRVLRCNPFSKGGYDPVPERGFRNPPLTRAKASDIPETYTPLEQSGAEKSSVEATETNGEALKTDLISSDGYGIADEGHTDRPVDD